MPELRADLDDLRAAQELLDERISELTDEDARRPSLLPEWSVGHVLTHIARNADGMRNMVEGAAAGEVRAQYPGGLAMRNGDIAAGAGRPAVELVADVRDTSAAFLTACATLDDHAWNGWGSSLSGRVAVADVPSRRRREVIVHHSDLGLGYTWTEWPGEFVRSELRRMTMQWASRRPMGLTALPPLALGVADAHRLAWLLGRAEIPGLAAAHLM